MTPRYMFHAPGVTARDVGSGSTLEHPVMLYDRPDPHGLIILLAGEREREGHRAELAGPLAELCALHAAWCLEG